MRRKEGGREEEESLQCTRDDRGFIQSLFQSRGEGGGCRCIGRMCMSVDSLEFNETLDI